MEESDSGEISETESLSEKELSSESSISPNLWEKQMVLPRITENSDEDRTSMIVSKSSSCLQDLNDRMRKVLELQIEFVR